MKHQPVRRAIEFIKRRAGAGWLVVRPLGRELHLRHVPVPARPGSHRARTSTSHASSRRPNGCAACRIPTAAGARRGFLRRSRTARTGHEHGFADGLGVAGTAGGRRSSSESVARGIAYLVAARRGPNGSWNDEWYTGTGFPRVFYLKYHMYAEYFPLLALATYSKVIARYERMANQSGSRRRCSGVQRFEFHAAFAEDENCRLGQVHVRKKWRGRSISSGADAGTAARLQPDLHRLRADSRIREHTHAKWCRWSECLAAADECGAPVVSICGGEPLIYKEIGKLTRKTAARKRHVYLCTNGMFLAQAAGRVPARSAFLLQCPSGRHAALARSGGGAGRRLSTPPSRASRRPKRRVSRSPAIPPSTWKPT